MGCQSTSLKQNSVTETDVAQRFVSAYNAHDIPAMMALVHDDIKYMFISGDQIHTETNGKDHLNRYLVPFFENKPNAKSRIRSSQKSGGFIQLLEEAVFVDDEGNDRSQCSFSMYQLKNDVIINVWYFDAHACD
nr:nuclear transport factor 2 family protein [Marinicella rhabdoformis]